MNKHQASGGVKAEVIISFPEAARCFDDARITNYEQLKECLELVTNKTWTVSIAGDLEKITKLLPPDGAEETP